MRVDYTLPALQPEIAPAIPSDVDVPVSFRDHLHGTANQLPTGWEQSLRLDLRPFTATFVEPPPKPNSVQLFDPETERSRWHGMLHRHTATAFSRGSGRVSGSDSVQTMLEMLLEMQQMEDSIVSRQVAVTRG